MRSLSKVAPLSELGHGPRPSGTGVWTFNHDTLLLLAQLLFLLLDLTVAAKTSNGFQPSWSSLPPLWIL